MSACYALNDDSIYQTDTDSSFMDEQISGTSVEKALFFQRREDGGDSLEVSVVVQQGRLGLYGTRRNQTVHGRAHGDAALPAIQVDAGGRGVTLGHIAE